MSVTTEPGGRRSVRVEVEVQGTVEQVFDAIGTGPGISAWFVPTECDGRVGGRLSCDFGGGMVSSAEVTEWEPPHRFVAVDRTWLPDGPPVATTWTVEPSGGDRCVVRVEHSLHADSDVWDHHLEGTETGWPGFFVVLRHYLAHFAGQPSRSFIQMAMSPLPTGEMWNRLIDAIGAEPEVGASLRIAAPGARDLIGNVQSIETLPHGIAMTLHLTQPAPGVAMASAMDCMGTHMASLQAFYYGAKAAAAGEDREAWGQWLAAIFPPAPEAPPAD
jgi:uncharacterized protein YndB with AHSA1/START domain